MNKHALLFGIAAGLLLAAGTANAGTCSAEIEALQKTLGSVGTMASADAAPGASISQGANTAVAANTGSSSAPAPVPDPNGTDASGGMMASTGSSGPGADTGIAPGKLEQPDASGGTLAQSGAGNAAPPAQTAPLDSDAAQSGALGNTAAADQAGDEAACMDAVNQAKSQLGQQ
jgi:hypothetical protein